METIGNVLKFLMVLDYLKAMGLGVSGYWRFSNSGLQSCRAHGLLCISAYLLPYKFLDYNQGGRRSAQT